MSSLSESSQKISETLNTESIKEIIEKISIMISDSGGKEMALEWLQQIDVKSLLIGEGLVIIFMIIFRSYVFIHCKTFWSHMFAEIWTLAVYISLSLFFVPYFLFGSKYFDFIKIIFTHFNSVPN